MTTKWRPGGVGAPYEEGGAGKGKLLWRDLWHLWEALASEQGPQALHMGLALHGAELQKCFAAFRARQHEVSEGGSAYPPATGSPDWSGAPRALLRAKPWTQATQNPEQSELPLP